MTLHGPAPRALAPAQVIALPGATAAAVVWWTRGQVHVTVIAKATFAFAHDAEMPRAAPQEIFRSDIHHGNDPSKSIRFTSDLVPYLGRTDVLFTGHAFAPPGSSVLSLPVRLAVFDQGRELLDKRLLVQDRNPFRSLPVVYERAVRGASGQENPLGVDAGAGQEQPTLLDPQAPQRPAGVGPIARAWPARARLLGSTPPSMLDGPVQEIPEQFDWSYFQSAPPDQRIDSLRGGEWIVLQGLHPTVPHLRMRLPEVRGLARVHGLTAFGVNDGQALALHADTLRIDGEEQRCTVVFRRSFPLASEAALAGVRVVAGVEQAGAPLAWPPRIEDRVQPGQGAATASGVAPAGVAPGAIGGVPGAIGSASKGVAAAAMTAEIAEGALPAEPRPAHPFRPAGAIGGAPGAIGVALKGVAAAAMTAEIAEGALPAEPRPAHPFRPAGAPVGPTGVDAVPASRPGPSAPGNEPAAAPRPARGKPPVWARSTLDVGALPDEASQGARALPFQVRAPGELLRVSPLNAAAAHALKVRIASGTLEVGLDEPAGADSGGALPFVPPDGLSMPAHATEATPVSPPQGVADEDTWASWNTAPGPGPGAQAPLTGAAGEASPGASQEAAWVAPTPLQVAPTPLQVAPTPLQVAPTPLQYAAWPAEPALLTASAEPAPAAPAAPIPAPGTVPYFSPEATVRPAPPPAPEPQAAPEPEPAPPEPDPADFPLDRFAAISAELAEARAPRAEVLAAHELSEAAWSAIDRRWTAALKKDAAHGAGRLRSAHDSAYVAAVERLRGPITPAEYARLVVGVERKQSDGVLDELRIHRPALMHVMRVWTKKAAADPRLFAEVGAALASLRAQ